MGVFLPVVAGCRGTGDGEAEDVGVRCLAGNFSPEIASAAAVVGRGRSGRTGD